ncbi:MAG: phosphoribosyl 1,2-cyclic phosphodiesterase [Chlamydiales bacterium]|jgi:phosphoribosyl 1,2-cyclic phosphodiesterase
MIGFCPLASGSRGNSIFFGTQKTKVLFDCGISGRATVKKLEEIGVDIDDIDAIIVSHEHGDHIQGLKVLACKKGIPVLANCETAKGITNQLRDCPKFKIFSTGENFEFNDLLIHPFSIPHDTSDPVAFTVKYEEIKVGICTDLGFATSLVQKQLQDCDYLYVEANHDPALVYSCPRPNVYKQRVLSRSGHLSNEDCGKLLKEVWSPKLKHVHLAHLSGECNEPALALETVKEALGDKADSIEFSIAFQDKISRAITFDTARATLN